MGYELVDLDDVGLIARMKSESPPRYPLQPQQLWIADALSAPGYDDYVIEIVRRAGKTTTIFCWLLGRCLSRPGYQVTFSAQNGVKSSARLREWKTRLDRTCPDPEAGLPPWRRGLTAKSKAIERQVALFGDELTVSIVEENATPTRGFRILMGEVGKGIYFDNGSQFLVFKPDADAYRGEGGDASWIDEAQEIDPDEGEDLLAGIVPLQDTKESPALIISGTAGEARVGPLWERVEKIRSGHIDQGGLDYCAPEDTPWEAIAPANSTPTEMQRAEDSAIAILLTVHPGIGTLTTEAKMRKNYRKFGVPQWSREYLSMWPETMGARAIDPTLWDAGRLARKMPRPARVAFGMAIKPGSSVACIVAAWRSPTGIAYGEIVEHKTGTDWLPKYGQKLASAYRGSTIGYDDIGEGKATAQEMLNLRPRPRLRVLTYREIAAGCIQFERDLARGKLKHFGQSGLEEAVTKTAKREVRGDTGVWLYTPVDRTAGDDITPVDAFVRALRNWDQYFARGQRAGDNSTEKREIPAA